VDDLLTVIDVARILKVSGDSVRIYERQGRLPALKTLGGIRIFKRSDVERFSTNRALRRIEEGGLEVDGGTQKC
jgi:excisionase family DNA binding protein